MRLKLIVFFILLVLAGIALSEGAQINTSATNNSTSSSLPRQMSSWELFGVVLIIVIFASAPILLNNYYAHHHLTDIQKTIDQFVAGHDSKADEDKIVQLIHEYINADPNGSPGTARGAMALTITLIVGIALFVLVAYPPDQNTTTTVKEVILTLTGALTSIIGFYFGGKGSEPNLKEIQSERAAAGSAEEPKAEEPKAELYNIKEDLVYEDKQYTKGTTVDLANVPAETRKVWIENNKIEPYVGEQKDVQKDKELKDKPGWYKIKMDFRYHDGQYIKDNIMNLTEVPASILAEWKKNKWVEPA